MSKQTDKNCLPNKQDLVGRLVDTGAGEAKVIAFTPPSKVRVEFLLTGLTTEYDLFNVIFLD